MSDAKRLSDNQLRTVVYAANSVVHGAGVFMLRDIENGEQACSGGSP